MDVNDALPITNTSFNKGGIEEFLTPKIFDMIYGLFVLLAIKI